MKIGQTPPGLPASGTAESQKSAKNSAAGTAAAPSPAPANNVAPGTAGVPVTVSPLARSLGPADRAGNGEFNAARVESVRKAIDRGEFKVDAEAVADKLLSNAQEHLVRSRSSTRSSS